MKYFLMILLMLSFSNLYAQQADTTTAKKQFLYVLRLTEKYWLESNWDDEASKTIQMHFQHLKDIFAEGRLILAGRTETDADKTMGLCILEAASLEEAEKIAKNDPAVKAGIMSVEVFPYNMVLMRE